MTDLELIFSMLGEAATTEITKTRNVRGFVESHQAAHEGGQVAGKARQDLEHRTGQKVVSSSNYLQESQTKKLKGKKEKEVK
jgi:hypothetical protein